MRAMRSPMLLATLASTVFLASCGGGSDPIEASAPAPAPAPSPAPAAPVPAPPPPAPSPPPIATPAPVPTPKPGSAQECHNALLAVNTVRSVFQVRTEAGVGGQFSVQQAPSTCRAGSSSPCHPQIADRSLSTLTETRTSPGPFGEPPRTVHFFEMDGVDRLTHLSVRSGGAAAEEVAAYQPPARDARFGLLAPGDSVTAVHQATITRAGTAPITQSRTVVTTYLGQESVPVPIGTTAACKFRISDGTTSYHEWIEKHGGVRIKLETPTGPKYGEELVEKTIQSIVGI
jgi:hypothetical protein